MTNHPTSRLLVARMLLPVSLSALVAGCTAQTLSLGTGADASGTRPVRDASTAPDARPTDSGIVRRDAGPPDLGADDGGPDGPSVLPDLVVALHPPAAMIRRREPFDLGVRVENIGDASRFDDILLQISLCAAPCTTAPEARIMVAKIFVSVGGDVEPERSIEVTIPNVPFGRWELHATIDGLQSVAELDESNNDATPIEIGVHPIVIDPITIDFGVHRPGCATSTTVRLTNVTSSALGVTSVRMDGAAASAFTVTAPPLPFVLGAGHEQIVEVTYLPAAVGLDQASFVVSTPGEEDATANVRGRGDLTETVVDRFVQHGEGVDYLFVVDDSGSMFEEQQLLASNTAAFFQRAEDLGIDYHIGVTTTDMDMNLGRLVGSPAVVSTSLLDPRGAFTANVTVGTTGSGFERGLAAARAALSMSSTVGPNAGFLRPQSDLVIFFVSDEEDQSPGDVDEYVAFFLGLKGQQARIDAYAIVGDAPAGCATAQEGTRYIEVEQALGGAFESICSAEWGRLFAAAVRPDSSRTIFYPSKTLDPATLVVTVDGVVRPGVHPGGPADWYFDTMRRAVVFDETAVPPNGAVIELSYAHPTTCPP